MDDELEFVCERCVHYDVCDRSSRMIWARLSKEKVCSDFMEVVRCKDCENWRWSKNNLFGEDYGTCVECLMDTKKDHFCSYGERKDNERKTD